MLCNFIIITLWLVIITRTYNYVYVVGRTTRPLAKIETVGNHSNIFYWICPVSVIQNTPFSASHSNTYYRICPVTWQIDEPNFIEFVRLLINCI